MEKKFTLTRLATDVFGVTTFTHPLVRKSQNLMVRSWLPLTNMAPPQLYNVNMCPTTETDVFYLVKFCATS